MEVKNIEIYSILRKKCRKICKCQKFFVTLRAFRKNVRDMYVREEVLKDEARRTQSAEYRRKQNTAALNNSAGHRRALNGRTGESAEYRRKQNTAVLNNPADIAEQ